MKRTFVCQFCNRRHTPFANRGNWMKHECAQKRKHENIIKPLFIKVDLDFDSLKKEALKTQRFQRH